MTERRKAPTKTETALLEPFEGLTLENIVVPATAEQFAAAETALARLDFVGFDTESRPTFNKGEVSAGPHVVQFATTNKAYIFQLYRSECPGVLLRLLESTTLVKVGFDLKSDQWHLQRKLDIRPNAILDLSTLFRQEGYANIGVRAAVALTLNQRFHKSKHTTTSNWALHDLSPNQLVYAANDAYAALRVLQALNRPAAELPIAHLPEGTA